MKVGGVAGIVSVFACMQIVQAQPNLDKIWLFKDNIPDTEMLFFEIYLCDTTIVNTHCFSTVDTGDRYDGAYINFDYQFGGINPGYAGFKIFWDMGFVYYNATSHDSMCFMHKGPLPGHKVRLQWGRTDGCGAPITYQDFGEFKSSIVWKKEAIAFPPGFIRTGLFELRMLINNDTGTSATSPPGCLKIDNICFVKELNQAPVITSTPGAITVPAGQHYSYAVSAVDPNQGDTVTLSLTIAPTGMTISKGVISWTPTQQQIGNNPVMIRVQDNHGASVSQSYTIVVSPLSAIVSAKTASPPLRGLSGNVVNGRQGRAAIHYVLAQPGPVSMDIYSFEGRCIRRIEGESGGAGSCTMIWDGNDGHGGAAAAGAYIVRVKLNGISYDEMIFLAR
jgi:hypothetical protein